jgi:nucleotide-binding universal stress UspA family protein
LEDDHELHEHHRSFVHAYGLPVYGFPDGVLLPNPEVAANLSNVAQQALDSTVKKAISRCANTKGVLREGDPREEIEAVAEDLGADLIVVGTHGRRAFKRWILGSVTQSLVRTSKIPVLTVPGPEAR